MNEIKTLKELVYRADDRFGDESFVIEYKKKEFVEHSYKQFRKDCDSLGAWINEHFPERVHAAIIGLTSYEYLVAWFGIQCSGNVSVPLDNANNAEKIADEINRSDTVGDIVEEYKDKMPTASSSEKDLTAILFTSGTTGKSKGVMLSNGNLIDNATCEPDLGYHGNKRMTVLPIHHVYCFTCDILCSLWYGRKLCINDSLMRIIKNLKIFRPVDVTFVPMISASILNRMKQLAGEDGDKIAVGKEVFGDHFSIIYSGGAYLSPDIIKGFSEFGIEIAQGYGMTECSPRICSGIKNCPKPDSVGEIVPGCEVRIVDGEIQVKSKSVMMGYYKNPEETAKTISEDGWLMTGDLGYKDDDGYLYITGRKKNLIILSNGENVSPEEIENQFAYFEPVKEIVVYDKNGQITAEIYPNPDYECDNIRDVLQQKIDEVNDTFPAAKQIVNLVIRDKEFEKTASKKIIRASITK